MVWKELWSDIPDGPYLGDLEGFLVGNCDGEVLGRSYGVLVEQSERGGRLVHQIGLGSGNVRLGVWWDWWTAGCSEVSKPRLMDHAHRYTHDEGRYVLLNAYYKS